MIVVFFDTETNGLPKNWKAKVTEVDNWPRITQFAWRISDGSGGVDKNYLIKPDGWTIPDEKFFIENNMTTERCEMEGREIRDVLNEFAKDLAWAEVLASHNMSFDYNVVGAEMIRKGISSAHKPKRICTKEGSTSYCQLPGPHGFKWPKLEELHRHLFGCDFEGAHDAMADVYALESCFWELFNRKVIQI